MHTSSPLRVRRAITTTTLAAVVGLAAVACGSDSSTGMSGMDHGSTNPSTSASQHSMPGMPGMDGDMPTGDGLTASASGFRFAPSVSSLPANQAASVRFQIQGADGKPVTAFESDQTKLMHFYLVRSDLTGFQHIHPEMAADGTWTAPVAPLQAGTYRAYTSFITKDSTGKAVPLVLSEQITVPGSASTQPVPAASTTTQVDGYTLTLSGDVKSGMAGTLTVAVSQGGKPVTDLQPYLDTYAHLTAFHEGDLAFAHLHPQGTVNGDHGGPTLSFHAELPRAGNWRLFVQFQTGGTLRTATVTLTA
ncbi:hypothetical protein [Actinokineospora inagensis]|uniref:hypothetical protein n=1 Tax=Actinokineospora inagensis TaxID=103730 RepID=UPI0004218953|nr:hypothetical protein [Actinokineospora inagensis]